MKTLLTVCFGLMLASGIVKAQGVLSGPIAQLPIGTKIDPGNGKVKVLGILKTDTGYVRTNNLIVKAADIEDLNLPSKAIASKTMGPIEEDVVAIFTVKNNVSLLRLPDLLAKNNIDKKYLNSPVYIDGKLVTQPGPVIVAESMVKSVTLANAQIHIHTNMGGKGALGLN